MKKLLAGITCLLAITITACGGGGGGSNASSSSDTSTSSSASTEVAVTLNGTKYICGDSTRMAAQCIGVRTTDLSVSKSSQNVTVTATYGQIGCCTSGWSFNGFANGDVWIYGIYEGAYNDIVWRQDSPTHYAADVYLPDINNKGWAKDYWWEKLEDGLIIGWE